MNYEICRLLAAKKTPKVKKESSPRIMIGASCLYCGVPATVTAKHNVKGWYTVTFVNGAVTSGDRKLIKLV